MLYNKNRVRKANDKKILRKVGKQWKVVSVALLMALAGAGVASTNVSASNVNSSNNGAKTTVVSQPQVGNSSANNSSANNSADLAGVTQSNIAKINSLISQPQVSSASANSNSSSNASQNNGSASQSSNISYLNGDNGSAASYHAKAESDKATIGKNKGAVNYYVNSLNNEFPTQTKSLKSNANSASAKYASDEAGAKGYNAVVHNKNYGSALAKSAASEGMTSSEYIDYATWNEENNSNAVVSDKNNSHELSLANSYAKVIDDLNGNTPEDQLERAEYSVNADYAQERANVANANLNNAKNIKSAVDHKITTSGVNHDAYLNASVADQIGLLNSKADAGYVKSLATSLGFNNSYVTSAEVQSMASNYNNNPTEAFTKNGEANKVVVPVTDNHNSLKQVLTDTQAMDKFSKVLANYHNDTSLSAESSSANNALVAAESNASVANSVASAANILGGKEGRPTLANIFGIESTNHTYNSNKVNGEFANELKDILSKNNAKDGVTNNADLATAINTAKSDFDSINVDNVAGNLFTPASFNVQNVYNAIKSIYGDNAISEIGIKVLDQYNNASAFGNFNDVKTAADNINTKVNALNTTNADKSGHFDDTTTSGSNGLKASGNGLSLNSGEFNSIDELLKDAAKANGINNVSGMNDTAMNSTIIPAAKSVANTIDEIIKSGNIDTVSALGHYSNSNITASKLGLTSTIFNKYQNDIKAALNNLNSESSYADIHATLTNFVNAVNELNSNNLTDTINSYNGLINSNDSGFAQASAAVAPDVGENNAAGISGLASTANSNLTSAENNASTFDDKYAIPLATYYANSYSNDLSADSKANSSASSALQNFYNDEGGATFAKANSDLQNAQSDLPNSINLANAYSQRVFNYAPKYINVIKGCWLHNATDYSRANHIATVMPKHNQSLPVVGVGFSDNGTTRWITNLPNGTRGYITNNALYVKPTYLLANKVVKVTAARNIGEYKDANFTKHAKTIKAGTKLTGVVVPMPDSKFGNRAVYGGFTRIKLSNGNYITANTDWINLDATPKNAVQKNNKNNKKANNQSDLGFFDSPNI